MIRQIVMIETGPTPKHLKRHLPKIMKGSLHRAASEHHRLYTLVKFTRAAFARYPEFTPRKGEQSGIGTKAFFRSYTGRKQRQIGHRRPLVWSGASEILAKIRDIRSNSKRARIVQHARGLNRRNPNSLVNMRREITATTSAERAADRAVFRKHFLAVANAISDRTKRVIS